MITAAGVAVQTLTWCGRNEEAAGLVDRLDAYAQRAGDVQARIWAALNIAEHAWRTGDLHTAIDTGLTCLELLSSSHADHRLALATAPVVRVLVECDHASAQRLAEEELHQASAFGAPRALGIALRAAGLTVRGGRGQRLMEESAALLDEAGATLEQARSLIDLATLRFESGHTRLARELARRSLQLAQHCGATALSNRALDRLRTLGGRPRRRRTVGIQALTESERRVVVLAAQGLTNREIAQQLFITRRTVENHLTSSFRKLSIT
ncbi:hypothetical protein GR925_21600 [Streptomyces sp. HUCO-GS316]|uniref:helix-turn-helix transcriptional regulator n=1 Tax=Streptomyces sp. HUCO-GS316 TaxID=2692198 RepID=UPI001370ACDA|nr:LuxR C-terminal-related transcriptional regulator [Streptomyces sp. HUCO-GS316]MXM65973.1 hypothetical protein [Streptomyces sp. HUCO-GS316]